MFTFHVSVAFRVEDRIGEIFGRIIWIERGEQLLSEDFAGVLHQAEYCFSGRKGEFRRIVDWGNCQLKNEPLPLL